jgi:hypothetical protein
VLLALVLTEHKAPTVDGKPYPPWATAVGWTMTMAPIFVFSFFLLKNGAVAFFRYPGRRCRKAWSRLLRPTSAWRPTTTVSGLSENKSTSDDLARKEGKTASALTRVSTEGQQLLSFTPREEYSKA